MVDLFEKLKMEAGPLAKYSHLPDDYFFFPKLEGEIGPHMIFNGKKVLNWSLNNYLGLANHPEVRKADADAAAEFGLGYPMGARMMSGNSKYHVQLEKELAAFVKKEDAMLLNFGYQGVISIIDAIVNRKDVIVYDAESHACIIDGVRLHMGKRFVYAHNDMDSLEKRLPNLGLTQQRKAHSTDIEVAHYRELRDPVFAAWPTHSLARLSDLGVIDGPATRRAFAPGVITASDDLVTMYALMSADRWVDAWALA